ncbi:MAG: tRNA (adenosine(37)-N6)-dimethylallyltransferase MiaA [Longimicrobiales bacterium]
MASRGTVEDAVLDPNGRVFDALVIAGATATGKSALALAVAERVDGEIISMDSRQVYRGLDVGTAKATPAERARIPHHGLDLIGPEERYSAGRFARDARAWIRDIRRRGRVPVLVGGTGFFLRALTQPLFQEPALPEPARTRLRRRLGTLNDAELARWLGALDSDAAARLAGKGGRQRRERAVEIALLTGRTLAWWHRHAPAAEPAPELLVFVLERPRRELYPRIDARVERMIEAGLVEEVRALLSDGHSRDSPALSATGYAEIATALAGELDLEEAKQRIRAATRRYARRQITWFRHQLPDDAVRLDARLPRSQLVERIVDAWRKGRPH